MVFHKGDEVIVNGLYSGIIVRATPERDMYVVRYRHRSENKLVNIMHRGGELDLMAPLRPNPPPELWSTFIHRLDPPLEFDTSKIPPNMIHTKGLEHDQQVMSANFFFVPAEHPPYTRFDPWTLTLPKANFFDRFLTDFYQSNGWDKSIAIAIAKFNRFLGRLPPSDGFIVDGITKDTSKDLDFEFFFTSKHGTNFTSNFGHLHEVRLQVPFDIFLRDYEDVEGVMKVVSKFEAILPYNSFWNAPTDLHPRGFPFTCHIEENVFLALEFEPSPDPTAPFYTFDYSPRMIARTEGEVGQEWGGTIEDWLKDPANRNWGEPMPQHYMLDPKASLDRHLPSLPTDDPHYQQSEASELIDDALAESIKKSYWDDYFGFSDSPLPRGRSQPEELADLRGESDWLYPYIQKFKAKLKKNPPIAPMGRCYPFAFELALTWSRSQPDEESADDLGLFRVIHGRITNKWTGQSTLHAWVEKGGLAFDWQSRREGIPIDWYYEEFNPEPFEEYSALDVLINCARHGHYGPWEEDL